MNAVKYTQLDSETFEGCVGDKAEVVLVEDMTGKVPHVGYGGASKSTYVSPKTGKTVFVLERNGMYAPDSYANDVWLFENDFTAEEAREFITVFDAAKQA